MDRSELLAQARLYPATLRFRDVCALAESFGWVLAREAPGSHRIYKRAGHMELVVLQEGKNGMAKVYQVRQIVRLILKLGEIQ